MEVFKCGHQTDSAGNTKKWTENDLDKIVSQFEKGDAVPATIGHPESDTAPAFAWFKKVFRKGDTLVAEMSDVVDEFGTMLKNKMFKNRSIALRPDMSLRHIAFLGASAPAVKGLADFAFSATDEFTAFDFAETEADESKLKKVIKDIVKHLFNEKLTEDQEMATVEELEKKVSSLEGTIAENEANFAEKEASHEAEKKEFSEKLTAETKRADDADAKITEASETAKTKEFSDFVDEQIEAGRILPAHKDGYIKTLKGLNDSEEMEFSENGETKKLTALDIFKNQLSSGEKKIDFGEQIKDGATKTGAGDQLAAKTVEIEKANPNMSYSECFKKAQDENPELTKLYNK